MIRSKRAKRSDVDDKPNSAITTSAIELSTASPTAQSRKSGNVKSETRVGSSRARNSTWSSEFLLTNPKSKLAKCNLTVLALICVISWLGTDQSPSLGSFVHWGAGWVYVTSAVGRSSANWPSIRGKAWHSEHRFGRRLLWKKLPPSRWHSRVPSARKYEDMLTCRTI